MKLSRKEGGVAWLGLAFRIYIHSAENFVCLVDLYGEIGYDFVLFIVMG